MNGRGAVGLRPLNAPRAPSLPPAVVPGSRNVLRARVILVYGPAGAVTGVFVYAPGTIPGPGNAPIVSLTNQNKDPFGNSVVPGVGTINAFGQSSQLSAAALNLFNGVNQTVRLDAAGLALFGTAPVIQFTSVSGPPFAAPAISSPNATTTGAGMLLASGLATGGSLGVFAELLDSLTSPNVLPQLVISQGTTPAGAPLTGGLLEAQGTIEAAHIAPGDTTTYDATGRATKIVTGTPQTINQVAAQTVNGISFPVASGLTYELDCLLFCTAGPNPVLSAAGVAGPGTSFCSLQVEGIDTKHGSALANPALGGGNQVNMGALTNYVNNGTIPAGDTFTVSIRGRFTTTAQGAVTIIVNTSVAANTYTLNNGSYCTLIKSI